MPDFIVVPSRLTSVLDAVNQLIFTLGETPVSTIDPPPTSDVDMALVALAATDLQVQTEGWHWNKEYSYSLTLDGDGRAVLPDQTLMVAAAYYTPGSYIDVVQRGPYLYDLKNHTFVFTKAPTVDLTIRQPWDYIPQATRTFITLSACQMFHAALQEREILLRVNDKALSRARVIMDQVEDASAKWNSFHDNISANMAFTGGGAIRRNRAGY